MREREKERKRKKKKERLSALTEDFGNAEFSVTEARSGLVIIQKQLNIEKK